jgi:hypothetical protein
MRQPATTPLQLVVDALPDAALRPLLLELLQNGATSAAPLAPDAAEATTPPATPAPATRRGWPRGKPRGRKAAAGETEFARTERLALKAAAQRQRDSEKRRQKRAAAQLGLPTVGELSAALDKAPPGPTGKRLLPAGGEKFHQLSEDEKERRSNGGTGSALAARLAPAKTSAEPAEPVETALAAKLWQRATELSPPAPWKAVAQEFGINSALALDHFRRRSMPPVAPAAVARFVEATPAS